MYSTFMTESIKKMTDPGVTVQNNDVCEVLRLELTRAMFHNDESQIKYYLSLVSEVGCDQELEAEVSSATLLLQRMDKQRDILSEGLKDCLSKHIITEIRSFMNPPEWVKTLITATLLLLGYTKRQAADWCCCSRVLGKYGQDSLLNTIYRVNIRTIPVHTALAAREMIKHMSLEGIMKINLACGALFTWVNKTIDAVLANADLDISNVHERPQSSKMFNRLAQTT